jgi:hypothetical protein
VLTSQQDFHVEKLSYQMTPGNRLTAVYHGERDRQVRGANRFVPADSREIAAVKGITWKGEWQAVRGNSLVTSLQYGEWDHPLKYYSVAPGKIATTDISTLYVTGTT